jgi:hypothetical protein
LVEKGATVDAKDKVKQGVHCELDGAVVGCGYRTRVDRFSLSRLQYGFHVV